MEEVPDSMPDTRTRVGQWLTDLVSGAETGIPVTKVFRLYQEDFGEHFPMRQLSCFNPVKALESMPEFVSIETNTETGEKLIFPATFKETTVSTTYVTTNNHDNEDIKQKKTLLKSHRGTYQLTFINHFQLEKCVLLDYFQQQDGFVGANILSGLKRRCFVSYKREEDALTALENLKGNETLVDLDVADDCKLENYDDLAHQNKEEEIPEMFQCRGSFQLSFTTDRFINIGDINSMFSDYGQVSEVCSNFRKIKGRARVFVKYLDKIQAITALRQLRHQFDDLGVAKCCLKDDVRKVVIPEWKDGTFSVRFKNIGPEGDIFRRQELYQMFGQFGEVVGIKTDIKGWTYIKYNSQEEAMAAYHEFSLAQNLPSFGVAENRDDPNSTIIVKKTKFEVEETDMEIFISNFPAKIGVNKLRKIFTNFQEITFREFKVNNTKAFCFAQLPDYEEMKRAVREMHGSIHYNRNLIVRAKIQDVQERIEAELLEEMASDRDMLATAGEDWEAEASQDNVYYDENLPAQQKQPQASPGLSECDYQPIPTITGNRPTEQKITPEVTFKAEEKDNEFQISPPAKASERAKLFQANYPVKPFQEVPTAKTFQAAPNKIFQSATPIVKTFPAATPAKMFPVPPPALHSTKPYQANTQAKSFQPPLPSGFFQTTPVADTYSAQADNFQAPPPSKTFPYPPPFTRPPPPVTSFSCPPPARHSPRQAHPNQSVTRTEFISTPHLQQGYPRPSLTKPPQRQSFLSHNPRLRVAGITPLSQPFTTKPTTSVSQDSGYSYSSSSTNTSLLSNLGDIQVSVDNNFFTPEKISRKRKSEPEPEASVPNPLKDEGIELVLANFAEGTSGAEIFKLLDPFNVAGVNMAVNKLTPNDDFTYSFVRFNTRQEAEEAIQQLDGKALLNSGQIVLEFA